MREIINISSRREKTILALAVAMVGFGVGFFVAPLILHEVYGITPLDPGYRQYADALGNLNTPYQDFIVNGCMTEPNNGQDTIILDTKGLDELGMFYYDPNTCFDIAKSLSSQYDMSVKTTADNHMTITLTKKK